MANNEVARATVTIVPTMEGAQSKITQDLTGAASSPGVSKAGETAGSTFTSGLSKGLAAAAAVTTAAIGAAAAGVTAITKSAVDSFADYEQLSGGIETLFGESADAVMAHADQAFKTAGLSVNEYMDVAISSAASMINSVGGDVEKAAALTDQAITDMADNVNKMGTSMEAVQNAYRGFSRGNFTMLDNLALGFAGTKEGMQELLDSAKAISGVDYDIDSYADIVEAIHVVQTEMGITGTTAKEASETISGSVGAMKASWENLMAGLANPSADIDGLVNDLIASAETVLTNIIPVVERIVAGLASVIEVAVPVIAERLPAIVEQILPSLLSAAVSLVQGIVAALPTILEVLIAQIPLIIDSVVSTIVSLLPMILELGFQLILALAQGLITALPDLIPAVVGIITSLAEMLSNPDSLDTLINTAIELVETLAFGLIDAIPVLLPAVLKIIIGVTTALLSHIPELIECAFKLIGGLVKGLGEALPQVAKGAGQIIKELLGTLAQLPKKLAEMALGWGKDLIDNFVGGIKNSINKVGEAVSNVANKVKSFLGFSEPEEGPLSDFHTYAPDMIDLFTEGLQQSRAKISSTLTSVLQLPGQTVPEVAGADGSITIPIYLGDDLLDTVVANANQRNNLRSGGVA